MIFHAGGGYRFASLEIVLEIERIFSSILHPVLARLRDPRGL